MVGKSVFNYVAAATLLWGCTPSPQQQAEFVHIVQPGDTSKTCPEFAKEINAIDLKIGGQHKSVKGQETASAVSEVMRSQVPASAYDTTGSVFGSLLGSVGVAASTLGQHQLHNDRESLNRLKQRRDIIVGHYNNRCIGSPSKHE